MATDQANLNSDVAALTAAEAPVASGSKCYITLSYTGVFYFATQVCGSTPVGTR